jgi:hypothetical protein
VNGSKQNGSGNEAKKRCAPGKDQFSGKEAQRHKLAKVNKKVKPIKETKKEKKVVKRKQVISSESSSGSGSSDSSETSSRINMSFLLSAGNSGHGKPSLVGHKFPTSVQRQPPAKLKIRVTNEIRNAVQADR